MADSATGETKTVELPAGVVDRIEQRLPDSGFESVEDYAAAALAALLREVDRPAAAGRAGADVDETDGGDDDDVRRQLESLGYL